MGIRLRRLPWMIAGFGLLAALSMARAAEESLRTMSLPQMMLVYGGKTMWVLIGLSFLTVVMAVFFLFTLRRRLFLPPGFSTEVNSIVQQGDIGALVRYCEENASPAASIIGAAARVINSNPQVEYMVLRDVIEDEGNRQAGLLWQRIQYLMDIAVLSPMIGLLGTVVGMVAAFQGMTNNVGIGAINPISLAAGVSQALVTTVGGLLVGIFAMAIHAYFRGRIIDLVSYLEEGCSEVLQRLINQASRPAAAPRK